MKINISIIFRFPNFLFDLNISDLWKNFDFSYNFLYVFSVKTIFLQSKEELHPVAI